jgi:hypothetical protein
MKFDGGALYERLSCVFLGQNWHWDGGCSEVHVCLVSIRFVFVLQLFIHRLPKFIDLAVVSIVT